MVEKNWRNFKMIFPLFIGCTYFLYKGMQREDVLEEQFYLKANENMSWDLVEKTAELQERCTLLRYEFSQRDFIPGTEIYQERQDVLIESVDIYKEWGIPITLEYCLSAISGY